MESWSDNTKFWYLIFRAEMDVILTIIVWLYIYIYIHYQIYQIQDVAPQLQVSSFSTPFSDPLASSLYLPLKPSFFSATFSVRQRCFRVPRRGTLVKPLTSGKPRRQKGIPMGFPDFWPPFGVLRYTRPGKHTKNYGKSPCSMGKSTN